ncbi:MAG: Outer membrane protein assembly factor BamB [bacterium]|nr:Outer membrane protein assembly factor BamB [bacterium]
MILGGQKDLPTPFIVVPSRPWRPFLGVFLCLLMCVQEISLAADWPQWLGPERNGTSTETGWPDTWPEDGPRILWEAEVGTGFSGIAVVGARAYTMGNSDGKDTIFCFNTENGEVLWRHSYECPLFDLSHEGGPAITPTVQDGRVYTISRRGQVFCLDSATGAVLWSENLVSGKSPEGREASQGRYESSGDVTPGEPGGKYGLRIPLMGFTGSPLVVGNRLFLDTGRALAFDARTGTHLWSSDLFDESYSSPVCFSRNGQDSVIFFNGFGLLALNPSSGEVLWKFPWETVRFDTNTSTPILSGSRVFISSGYDRGAALVDTAGEAAAALVWQQEKTRTKYNTPLLWEGCLYGFDEKVLRCWDFSTGEEKWSEDIGAYGCQVIVDGKLLLLTERGELILARPSPSGFEELSRAHLIGGRCWTLPTPANGRIYLRNAAGNLLCLDVTPN